MASLLVGPYRLKHQRHAARGRLSRLARPAACVSPRPHAGLGAHGAARARPALRRLQGSAPADCEKMALVFRAPTKKTMASWLASLNYVRNVAAHHAPLFNRKLQYAPARPKPGPVPVLHHLRDEQTTKGVFGTYNALAVIGHLLPSIEAGTAWHRRLATLLHRFPASHALSLSAPRRPSGVGEPRPLASMTKGSRNPDDHWWRIVSSPV